MNNVQSVGNVVVRNVPQPDIQPKANNLHHVKFKADGDQFVRQSEGPVYTRPAILDSQQQINKMLQQQQKDEKNAKRKQNLSWIIGIGASLAIIAMALSSLRGSSKTSSKVQELTEQIKNIKSNVIKREATEELARKDYERSLYRIQDLITLDKLASTSEQRQVADIGAVKKALDSKIIGQGKAKTAVTDFVGTVNYDIKNKVNLSKPLIIAMDGPPGTCKSTLMASAADGLGMHLKKIPLSSIEKPGSLVGFERTYVGAKAGAIATGQIEGNTKKVFYMLDELEKCPRDVQNTLLSLLDDQAKFKDLYYNCEIDLSQSIFGITTNELEKLKGSALYDRIKPYVIKVDRYDNATKSAIGKIKLNSALKDNNMLDKVIVKDEIFDIIAKATTDDGGRETTQIAERKIITKLKNLLVDAKEGEKITVDKDFILKILQK